MRTLADEKKPTPEECLAVLETDIVNMKKENQSQKDKIGDLESQIKKQKETIKNLRKQLVILFLIYLFTFMYFIRFLS